MVGIFVVLYFLFLREFCIWYDNVDIEGCVIMGIIESIEMFFKGWCCEKFEGLVMNMWLLFGVMVVWYVMLLIVFELFFLWDVFFFKDGEFFLCFVMVKWFWLFLVILIIFMFSFLVWVLVWKFLFGEKEIL